MHKCINVYIHQSNLRIYIYICIFINIKKCIDIRILTHSKSRCEYTKLTQTQYRDSFPCCPHNHKHCPSLWSNVRPLLPVFRAVHTIYDCTHVGSTARNHQKLQAIHTHTHTHKTIYDSLWSTIALVKHTVHHISPATYPIFINRTRSERVCEQQRCHNLWPGLVGCSTMQRQLVWLRKRRQRATSARHTGRQVGALLLPSILVATCEYMYADETQNMYVSWYLYLVLACVCLSLSVKDRKDRQTEKDRCVCINVCIDIHICMCVCTYIVSLILVHQLTFHHKHRREHQRACLPACVACWRCSLSPRAQKGRLPLHHAAAKQAGPEMVAALLHAYPDAASAVDKVRCGAGVGSVLRECMCATM